MVKLKKWFFSSDAFQYLGHVITPQRLHIGTKSINAVRDLKYSMTMFLLRSLRRLCNKYCQFVPHFVRVAGPLNKTLDKGQSTKFELKDNEQRTVSNLTQKLASPPVLYSSRPKRQFVIEIDVCNKQVCCVLLQEHGSGEFRPIGHRGRTPNDIQKNYDKIIKSVGSCLCCAYAPPVFGRKSICRKKDHQSM